MLTSIARSLPSFARRWKPLIFEAQNFARISLSQKVEEERLPDYVAERYYPARIGEIIHDAHYQLVGKLGYGVTSTVWLGRDLSFGRHVAIKVYIRSSSLDSNWHDELSSYTRMAKRSSKHAGYAAVRSLLDSFIIQGPNEQQHQCLVHIPLWESLRDFLYRIPERRLPALILAFALERLFLALEFLHTECQITHTDIKASNIMFGAHDDSLFPDCEEQQLLNPSPRKLLEVRTIYTSQAVRKPESLEAPVLCDFGSAVIGDEHPADIQPRQYRAPEVILGVPWTYSVDIWKVGCMIWDLYEGEQLFTGRDPESRSDSSRAHLAEMVALLGDPPPSLLARGVSSHEYFCEEGHLHATIQSPPSVSLEARETNLHGEDKAMFLRMMMKMLQWEPERRASAKQLAQDEWIHKQLYP